MKSAILSIASAQDELQPAKELVKKIRPSRLSTPGYASTKVAQLIKLLEEDKNLCETLSNYLQEVLTGMDFVDAFCESGILPGTTFLAELYRRVVHKILPELYADGDGRTFLARVFTSHRDIAWMRNISPGQWDHISTLLKINEWNTLVLKEQVVNALVVLSHRITSLGLEPELSSKLPDIDKLSSPFITQSEEILKLAQKLPAVKYSMTPDDTDYRHILVLLGQCEEILKKLRDHKNDFGASVSLTYILVRLEQQINRIKLLLRLFIADKEVAKTSVRELIFEMVSSEIRKNSLFSYINQNIDLIAYQVTEHGSKNGEHYITSSRHDYLQLFKSSAKGGIIVGFMALFKVLIFYIKMAPFWQAFSYSLNYAAGFMGMHLTHSALATKQPALTAQSIASSIQGNVSQKKDMSGIGEMAARVSRSQLVSFAGNLLVVFPMGLVIAFLYYIVIGKHLANPQKALHLIHETHPFHSGSLIFASIAGVYLFLTGIVAGYVDNLVIYRNIPERIKKHRLLKKIFSDKIMAKLSKYLEHNLGALASNVFFGICMGSTAVFGHFFGIGADVRHITFSTANFGIALVGLNFEISLYDIFWTLAGIVGIGFFNFMVSFNLAFYVALKSRNLEMQDTFKIIGSVWSYFITHPRLFLLPPAPPSAEEENISRH